MSEKALLRDHLGPSIAKALAKMIVPVSAITDPLVDFIGEHISDRAKADEALKTIKRLADHCLDKVSPEFERAKDVNPTAVAIALGETAELLRVDRLLAEDLKPERVLEMALKDQPLDALRKKAYGENNVQLYRDALPKLVASLLKAAPELKGYTVAKDREMLSRQRALGEDVGEIKNGLGLVDAWMQHKNRRWQAYGSDYCRFVDKSLNVIELIGLPTDGAVKEQRLSTAFIPLTLTHDSEGDEGAGSGYVETILSRLSADHPRLLITGAAGSGKTTLMRWAAIEAACTLLDHEHMVKALEKRQRKAHEDPERRSPERTCSAIAEWAGSVLRFAGGVVEDMKDVGAAWQLRIPFLIPLRDCQDGKLPPLDDFPEIGARYKNPPPEGWVQAVIEAGCALILVDGIDEVAKGDRAKIRSELKALCASFKGNYLVFTTRPGVVDDDWFSDLDVMRAEVNPLSERDRTALIGHWHEAAADKIGRDDAEQTASDLLEKLRRSPEIAQLGTSPLLAASICALHYAREGYLPRKQADLCKNLCEVLIHHRDLQRGVAAVQEDGDFGLLDYDHKEVLIQAMALAALRGGEPTLSRKEADELIENMLPSFDFDKALKPGEVRAHLVERAGVLREAFGGKVDFAHNTLRDFLAGQAFGGEPKGHSELARNANDQAWQRPIIFAAGAGSRDFAERLIRALISRGSRITKILAVLSAAQITTLDPELRQKVKAQLDDILPPKSTEEAELLAALGDGIVGRRLQRKRPKATAHACVRILRLIGTEKAREILRTYWQTEQQEIAEELAQIFNPLALPFWQAWVQKELFLPESVLPGVDDLTPLAGLDQLRTLYLNGTGVDDLTPLAGLANLQRLDLDGTGVADLAPLAGLANLQTLFLDGTEVVDVSVLDHIKGLTIHR